MIVMKNGHHNEGKLILVSHNFDVLLGRVLSWTRCIFKLVLIFIMFFLNSKTRYN